MSDSDYTVSDSEDTVSSDEYEPRQRQQPQRPPPKNTSNQKAKRNSEEDIAIEIVPHKRPKPKIFNQNANLHPLADPGSSPFSNMLPTTPPSSLAEQEAFKEKMMQTASQMKSPRGQNNPILNPKQQKPPQQQTSGSGSRDDVGNVAAVHPPPPPPQPQVLLQQTASKDASAHGNDVTSAPYETKLQKWGTKQQRTHHKLIAEAEAEREKKKRKISTHPVPFPASPDVPSHQPVPQVNFSPSITSQLPPQQKLLPLLPHSGRGGGGGGGGFGQQHTTASLPVPLSSLTTAPQAASMHHYQQYYQHQQNQRPSQSRLLPNLQRPPPPQAGGVSAPTPIKPQPPKNSTEGLVASIDKVLRAASEQAVLHHQLAVATDNLSQQLHQLRGSLQGLVTGVASGLATSPQYTAPAQSLLPQPQQAQQAQHYGASSLHNNYYSNGAVGNNNNNNNASIPGVNEGSIGPLLDFLFSR